MALHAAMVDRMDREIGRVLDQLRAMGTWDNTLILFLSDNGASAEIMVRDDGHDPGASRLGGVAPVPGAGLVHSGEHAVPAPQDLGARGGISTPLIVHWPREGFRCSGRAEARSCPRDRHRADDPRACRHGSTGVRTSAACACSPRTEPRPGLRAGWHGEARGAVVAARGKSRRSAWATGNSWRQARTDRGSCMTWRMTARRCMT